MIIYSVGFHLTEGAVQSAKAIADLIPQVGEGLFMMGEWEDQFPLYDIVRVKPHVIAIFLVEQEVGHVSAK